ncbi:hypothetical protein [Sneathiella sp.]|uniref:hypothetical protein n=1 Tax=Sneathiella sp. TaxID=1964365 RepID=UPI00262786D4|nr:hypothetical protein [Sneathiella sp.]MDF2368391.1 hypothetical protein [Sneathiella sp.]
MRPATRSTFDILCWLKNQSWTSDKASEAPYLLKLLYLAQALYAASHKQRKLMPATFLATAAGPIDPDIFLALENDLTIGNPLSPSTEVEGYLSSFYAGFKDKGQTDLDFILSKDAAIRSAMARGRNSEISITDMAAAYKKGLPPLGAGSDHRQPALSFRDGGRSELEAAPNAKQEVRFTADGRSVTKWMPKKRIVTKGQAVLN